MAQVSGNPKTSIFDLTLPGCAAPVSEVVPENSAPLPRARTSVFDATLTDIPAPKPSRAFFSRLAGLFARTKDPMAPEEPLALPALDNPAGRFQTAALPLSHSPRTSIFDITQSGLARPDSKPLEDSQEVRANPSMLQIPLDSEAWDEGTAAEWNPRWNPAPSPKPAPLGTLRVWLRRPLVLSGILASAAVITAIILVIVLYPRAQKATGADLDARPVPAALQSYQAKAVSGDAGAMRMLGLCYCYGIASPADWPQGVLWLRRAAKAGNATARKEMASMGITED